MKKQRRLERIILDLKDLADDINHHDDKERLKNIIEILDKITIYDCPSLEF